MNSDPASSDPASSDPSNSDPSNSGPAKPVRALGYEQARDQLVEVVQSLEQGGLGLDESLTLWERGEELAKRCEEHLAGARKRVEDALAARDPDDG